MVTKNNVNQMKYENGITCYGNICIKVWHLIPEPLWQRPPYLSHYIITSSGITPKLLADFSILENGRRVSHDYKKYR
jgi:hypothetical protein